MMDDATAARLLARQKSVLDEVELELSDLRGKLSTRTNSVWAAPHGGP